MTTVPAALGLSSDEVADVLATAGRAPSLHNSQPWRFLVRPQVIELWADPERRLPAADPTGREQRVACGAALFNLRLALHGLGIRPLVTLHADGDHPDLLASVRFGGRRPPTPVLRQLLAAVPRRHTNRLPFTDEPVTTGERAALRKAAMEEGAWLHMVENDRERSRARPPCRRGAHRPTGRPGVPGRDRGVDRGGRGPRRRRSRPRGRQPARRPRTLGQAGLHRRPGAAPPRAPGSPSSTNPRSRC